MTKIVRLTLDEIRSEKLDLIKQVKVFLISLVMVPVAIITHTVMTLVGFIGIPNKVIDMITLSEKTKLAFRKKLK